MEEFAVLAARSKALVADPEPRAFSSLNLDFFQAHLALIGNPSLRDITEQLFYRTARIWQQSVSDARLDLVEEVRMFDRKIDDIVTALRIGDLRSAAMINRAHISMSVARMQTASKQAQQAE
jgi:DNA-binding GntR family transcriptional regulator